MRTLYRSVAVGKPKGDAKHYDADATLLEDRVVLFQAKDSEAAVEQAIADARLHCSEPIVNIYGQKVNRRFLEVCESYEIVDLRPVAGTEVYSNMEVLPADLSDSKIVTRRMGKNKPKEVSRRTQFISGDVLKEFLAIVEGSAKPAPKKSK